MYLIENNPFISCPSLKIARELYWSLKRIYDLDHPHSRVIKDQFDFYFFNCLGGTKQTDYHLIDEDEDLPF